MSAARLTDAALRQAAGEHGVEVRALRAVMQVETGGKGGFLPDGRVRILFERHVLWKQLAGRDLDPHPFANDRPDLCGSGWNPREFPYGGEARQWERVQGVLDWAAAHAAPHFESYKKAALEACSWGLFQLLGRNYRTAGFPDVYAFKHAHEAGEAQQLGAALQWMDRAGLLPRLRERDWRGFALRYNGPGQVERYEGMLRSAYARAEG